MTVLLAADRPRPAPRVEAAKMRAVVEHAAVAAFLLWWAVPLTRGTGGREPHLVSFGLGLALLALVATRAWERTRSRELVAAAVLPVAALVVCLVAPTGWQGANDIGAWALASAAYVVMRSYVHSAPRAAFVLGVIALAGLDEFADSWLAWWGGRDPAQPMIGTLYWHNQYAAYLLAPALLGVALAVWPQRPGAVIGWVTAPLCSAGVLFSTSRGVIGLLVLGWLLVAALVLRFPGSRAAGVRLICVALLTAGTAFALTGPPFFDHRAAPSAAVAARSDRESAGGNAAFRTKTWNEALVVYGEYPIAGTGFHGFAAASTAATPGQPHSAFAHDAWLQAAADGGSVLGLPFLLVSIAAALGILRRLARRVRQRSSPHLVVAGVATLLLAAHSLIDFDLSYPALFVLLTSMTAVSLADPVDDEAVPRPTSRSRVAGLAMVVLGVVAMIAIQPAWHGGLHLNLAVPGAHAARAVR